MIYEFANEQWLWYLLLIIPLFLVFFTLNIGLRNKYKKVFGETHYNFLASSLSSQKRYLKVILQCLAIGFVLVSLARPQSGQKKKKVKSKGIELIFLVDVSRSMLAEDIKPSRLELAKKELSRFLDLSSGHRVGIIAFAGSAALVSPITTDRAAIKMYLDSLSPLTVSTQGTNFKMALEQAMETLKNGGTPEDQLQDSSITRAFIIASDGEDNEAGALKIAREIKDKGTYIFALAFGTEEGAKIPLRDAYGNLVGYRRDSKGKEVISKTKGTILKELAEAGGGSFYHVTFSSNSMKKLKADIDKLKQSNFSSAEVVDFDELYQPFLLLAILLMLIELLLSERKFRRGQWVGRFEVEK